MDFTIFIREEISNFFVVVIKFTLRARNCRGTKADFPRRNRSSKFRVDNHNPLLLIKHQSLSLTVDVALIINTRYVDIINNPRKAGKSDFFLLLLAIESLRLDGAAGKHSRQGKGTAHRFIQAFQVDGKISLIT